MYLLDSHCKYQTAEVVEDYDCTLNMTDLKVNNNKFYIMQVIKDNNNYYTYIRYGRIGEVGRISYQNNTLEGCISKFLTQFKSKTKNNWTSRSNFTKVPGKYHLCLKQKVDSQSDLEDDLPKLKKKKKIPESELEERVQSFIKLVGDIKMLQQTMKQLNVDTRKMPLGAISPVQLDEADSILEKINEVLEGQRKGDIVDMSSEYYTLVPFPTTRSSKPPIIKDKSMIDKYRDNLDELKNLKIAYTILENRDNEIKVNPVDSIYKNMMTEIVSLNKSSDEWRMIENYVFQTQGHTHHCPVELVDIYQVCRFPDKEWDHMAGNKHLLWHGTRLSNYISILQKGLVLRPDLIKGVYVTGKMFGYGIYGANSFSKSFNYTDCQRPGEEACLFLGEFALGKMLEKTNADYYLNKDKLEKEGGYHSTWGMGQYTPQSHEMMDTPNFRVKVPNGKLGRSGLLHPALIYDEFIVYDEKQIRLRYVVRVRRIK